MHGPQICRSFLKKKTSFKLWNQKYCLKKLPDFKDGLTIGFEQLLSQFKTDSFFIFENNLVFCCLENYNYKEIIDDFVLNPGN